jgi:EAL domain-containing protein (putative c-di-GMP-specific phosphodiesterase class I)
MTAHDPSGELRRFSGPHGTVAEQISIGGALSDNGFEIWYQPKIDLRRKCLAGAEALVRVHHPEAGLLWPEGYLGLLGEEELGRLVRHALLTTLRHSTMFAEAGFDLRFSIDVPATVLVTLPITALVAEHRPSSGNWPGLILEITEDQIVRDIALIRTVAGELKTFGIAIAIDDFGAGCSSLSGLRDLPFAEIKLHGSFVKNCAFDVTNTTICQTAIDLAHRFGSMAVADGIVSIADLQALIVMGCDFGQGMLVAPPMPQDRFLDALRQHSNRQRPPHPVARDDANRVA